MMSSKGYGKEQRWPNLGYHPGIPQRGQELSQGASLNKIKQICK